MKWHSEKRNIADLKPAEYNPRQATEKEVQDLTTSIERFDLADPIVINRNNTVIGGHFRIRILKSKNITEVDVRVPDKQLTREEERELNLRLNKNLGSFDFDMLANLGDDDLLTDVGFTDFDLGLAVAKGEGRLLYYHKDVECPFCHKQFKKPKLGEIINGAPKEVHA